MKLTPRQEFSRILIRAIIQDAERQVMPPIKPTYPSQPKPAPKPTAQTPMPMPMPPQPPTQLPQYLGE